MERQRSECLALIQECLELDQEWVDVAERFVARTQNVSQILKSYSSSF
jgi:hypothetical protein